MADTDNNHEPNAGYELQMPQLSFPDTTSHGTALGLIPEESDGQEQTSLTATPTPMEAPPDSHGAQGQDQVEPHPPAPVGATDNIQQSGDQDQVGLAEAPNSMGASPGNYGPHGRRPPGTRRDEDPINDLLDFTPGEEVTPRSTDPIFEIKDAGDRGRGLFSKINLRSGQTAIIEKRIIHCVEVKLPFRPPRLSVPEAWARLAATERQLLKTTHPKLSRLSERSRNLNEPQQKLLQDFAAEYGFRNRDTAGGCCIFRETGLMNHACENCANCVISQCAEEICVSTRRSVRANEELCINYDYGKRNFPCAVCNQGLGTSEKLKQKLRTLKKLKPKLGRGTRT